MVALHVAHVHRFRTASQHEQVDGRTQVRDLVSAFRDAVMAGLDHAMINCLALGEKHKPSPGSPVCGVQAVFLMQYGVDNQTDNGGNQNDQWLRYLAAGRVDAKCGQH